MKRINLLLLAMLFLTMCSKNEKIDWNTDLDFLAQELSEKHYNFFTIKSKDDFLSGLDAIKQDSKNLNDFQIALKTQQLIAKFGDSHTELIYNRLLKWNRILPIKIIWLIDGLYIEQTTQKNKKILGSQILSINNVPIATVIDSLSTLYTIDNQATLKLKTPKILPSIQILEYFGFVNTTKIELGLKTVKNLNETYILKTLYNGYI